MTNDDFPFCLTRNTAEAVESLTVAVMHRIRAADTYGATPTHWRFTFSCGAVANATSWDHDIRYGSKPFPLGSMGIELGTFPPALARDSAKMMRMGWVPIRTKRDVENKPSLRPV